MSCARIDTQGNIFINIQEWQNVSPDNEPVLVNYFYKDPLVRQQSNALNRGGQLELLELSTGLRINSCQFVGTVQLGDLRIAILPKIEKLPLLNLLRYAYGLGKLDLFTPLGYGTEANEFQDLLIQQLAFNSIELIQRGLYRKYERVPEKLQSPRGRIDFSTIAIQGGLIEANLPCTHHLRLEDNSINRTLLAGLNFAARLTTDVGLRIHLRKASRILEQNVSSLPLTHQLLNIAKITMDRLTFAYQPVLTIIEILLESQGISIESTNSRVNLPGFLFDMNRFFQALIEHFLKDNLDGFTVKGEYHLNKMVSYDPEHNPRKMRSPTPRPDFVILEGKKVRAILDTKYRNLWEKELPREMLYQLALYAFSQDRPGLSTILYPCLTDEAKESWINISHPLTNEKLATVKLRPINLYSLEKVIFKGTSSERKTFARGIIFGF